MEMGEKVDLGIKEEPIESALVPATPSEARSDREAKTRYPHFHYEGEEELEIPDEGMAMIKYKIVWKQEEESENGDHYACKIEVRSIQPCEGEMDEEGEEEEVKTPAKSGSEAANALDALMAALQKQKGD